MSKLSDYLSLKEKVDRLRADVSRSEGALEQLLQQLKREFKCRSLKDAKRLLQSLSSELEQLTSDNKLKLDVFEEKWSGRVRRTSEERD